MAVPHHLESLCQKQGNQEKNGNDRQPLTWQLLLLGNISEQNAGPTDFLQSFHCDEGLKDPDLVFMTEQGKHSVFSADGMAGYVCTQGMAIHPSSLGEA